MRVMCFDTSPIPREQRFDTERRLITWGDIEAVGDPEDYFTSSRFVSLGDVKLGLTRGSAVRYTRTQAHIDADERDHLTLRYFTAGTCVASLDGRDVTAGAGEGVIMDSARPSSIRYPDPTDCLIVHVPRFMLQPYFPDGIPSGKIAQGSALDRVVSQGRYVLAHAADLPEESAVLLGQSLRSLIVSAMLPLVDDAWRGDVSTSSLTERIIEVCDAADGELSNASLAVQVGADEDSVAQAVARYGGLDALHRRQRLIGAYSRLLDPRVTLSISQIARAAGYNSDAQFSRDFRLTFLLSPREARARHAGTPPRWAGRSDPVAAFTSLMTES